MYDRPVAITGGSAAFYVVRTTASSDSFRWVLQSGRLQILIRKNAANYEHSL